MTLKLNRVRAGRKL